MKKFNCVVMFPYPSGAGLHLGHYYNYALVDSYCRWLRLKGVEVNQPFGYDAFGLPAENYARSIGGDPREVTLKNIDCFRTQMKRMNTQFEERLVTCDPSYVKWTQWVFTKLHENGLAYKADGIVNWCPSCVTVLANEQVNDAHECERCGVKVDQRSMNQWYFKITKYKDRLLNNLDKIDYPESTKKQQRLWLKDQRDWCVSRQRKWGCPIPIEGETDTLDTFVDSSFYFLRYLTDSNEFLPQGKYRPVDLYVGGSEHACMHLIYARFIHYFLYDIGIVPQEEPFNKVIHQGMITAGGAKMGKSKGNAVNPDDYDPDELRMYLMFLGHYFDGGDWSDDKIVGLRRFFGRMKVWLNYTNHNASDLCRKLDLQKFEETLDYNVLNFKFNKVVSSFMEFYNKHKGVVVDEETAKRLVGLLQVFAPGFNKGKPFTIGDEVV